MKSLITAVRLIQRNRLACIAWNPEKQPELAFRFTDIY